VFVVWVPYHCFPSLKQHDDHRNAPPSTTVVIRTITTPATPALSVSSSYLVPSSCQWDGFHSCITGPALAWATRVMVKATPAATWAVAGNVEHHTSYLLQQKTLWYSPLQIAQPPRHASAFAGNAETVRRVTTAELPVIGGFSLLDLNVPASREHLLPIATTYESRNRCLTLVGDLLIHLTTSFDSHLGTLTECCCRRSPGVSESNRDESRTMGRIIVIFFLQQVNL